jgi:enoyl-CoA hydratase/carnithine racemase
MRTTTEKIIATKKGGVGRLTFNNPERRNAISLDMWQAIPEVLDDFAADDAVRVIVLNGAGGKAFSAGADISEFATVRSTEEHVGVYNAATGGAQGAISGAEKPTIAEIQGVCVGGGLAVALCCDLRIAGDDSRFAIPAAKLGIGYGYDGLRPLVDLVGPTYAKEIFFTGRLFDAEEARIMGLVNRVLPQGEVQAYVAEYAAAIAANAPLTVRGVKKIVGEVLKDETERDVAMCAALVDACFASDDYVEGRQAFMEKRQPRFKGR